MPATHALAIAYPIVAVGGSIIVIGLCMFGAIREERRRQRIARTRADMRAKLIADLRAHTDRREHHRSQLLRNAGDRVDVTHQDPA